MFLLFHVIHWEGKSYNDYAWEKWGYFVSWKANFSLYATEEEQFYS